MQCATTNRVLLFFCQTWIAIVYSNGTVNDTTTTPCAGSLCPGEIQHPDPQATVQKTDTQSMNDIITQLQSIDPLIWIIIALIFVICCLCSLLICYCVMQQRFNKEFLRMHTNTISGVHFDRASSYPSSGHPPPDLNRIVSNRSYSFDPSGPSQRTEITSLHPPTALHSRTHSPYSIIVNEPKLPGPIGLPRSKSADHGLLLPINSDKTFSSVSNHKSAKSLSLQPKRAHPLSFKPRDSSRSASAEPVPQPAAAHGAENTFMSGTDLNFNPEYSNATELTHMTSLTNASVPPAPTCTKTRSLPSSMVYTENYPLTVKVIPPQQNAYEPPVPVPAPPPPVKKRLSSRERLNQNLQLAMNSLVQQDETTDMLSPTTASPDTEDTAETEDETMSYAWTETAADAKTVIAEEAIGINQNTKHGIVGMYIKDLDSND